MEGSTGMEGKGTDAEKEIWMTLGVVRIHIDVARWRTMAPH